jgi:hypothetical protein
MLRGLCGRRETGRHVGAGTRCQIDATTVHTFWLMKCKNDRTPSVEVDANIRLGSVADCRPLAGAVGALRPRTRVSSAANSKLSRGSSESTVALDPSTQHEYTTLDARRKLSNELNDQSSRTQILPLRPAFPATCRLRGTIWGTKPRMERRTSYGDRCAPRATILSAAANLPRLRH